MPAWLKPPVLRDQEQTERAAILWFTMLLGLAVSFAQAVAYLVVPTMGRSAPVLVAEAIGMVAVMFAVRRGWLVLPATLMVGTCCAVITAFVFLGGGMELSFPPLLGTVAVMGALMLGPRAGAVLTAWATLCTVAVFAFGSSEILLIEGQDHRAILFTVQGITVLLAGGLVTYSVSRLSQALRAERHQTRLAITAVSRLEQARRFTNDIVRSMAEGVVVVRTDGVVEQVNDAAVRLFAHAASTGLVGLPLSDLVPGTDLDRLGSAGPGATAIGESVLPSGLPIRIARSLVKNEEGEVLEVYVLSDISHQVEAQRRSAQAALAAQEASLAKSQFLANMSHELRTPLNAVLGYTDLLLDEIVDPLHAADLGRVRQAGEHLLTLIDDVLDMSKVEAGRMELYLEPVNVAEVIREVEAAVGPSANRRRNRVSVEIDDTVVPVVTDIRKVRQILMNLASNAVKFTEDGEIRFRASATPQALRVDVVDNGIGIAPAAVERLFQAFVQADDSTSRRYGGTGLGLALSRRFAEMLGGTLTAVSAPGAGSTFTLLLPVRR